MSKNATNFWMDIGLFAILGVTILAATIEIFIPCFVHVILGLSLGVAAWIHIALHWTWIKNAFARFSSLPDQVRTSFVLNLALFLAYSAAAAMGLIARSFIFAGPLRHVLGFFHFSLVMVVLVLQTVHLVRHWKWVKSTARRVFSPA